MKIKSILFGIGTLSLLTCSLPVLSHSKHTSSEPKNTCLRIDFRGDDGSKNCKVRVDFSGDITPSLLEKEVDCKIFDDPIGNFTIKSKESHMKMTLSWKGTNGKSCTLTQEANGTRILEQLKGGPSIVATAQFTGTCGGLIWGVFPSNKPCK